MKKRISILFLIVGLLCITGGILYIVLNHQASEKKPGEKAKEEKPKEEIYTVDASYSCKKEEQSFDGEIEGTPMKFNYTNYYNFSYKEGEILYGKTGVNYQFLDQVSFDSFQWSEKNSSNPPSHQDEDKEKMTKSYSWLITISKEQDSYGLEEYLEQLSKTEYTCEKLGE